MAKDIVEVRWHGRGGQGAKTACLLFAEVAALEGKFVQGFPEYGPERMGAPITAYNRISDKRCSIHSNIYEPDFVVVLDDSLLDSVDVASGLKSDGAVIVNTDRSPKEMRALLKNWNGRVCTIDGRRISEEILGRNFPNTPLLAAVVKVSGVLDRGKFLENIEGSFRHKFATKPQVIEGNMKTLKRSLEEVREG